MNKLSVRNVSIKYITGDFKDIGLKEYVLRRIKGNYHVDEFWADRNITFELEPGDMLGIIGSNGAGKSTLLKAVAKIMEPSEGVVEFDGNVAALLELASGFDGDLTVKENAYLRGAMLGYTRQFMDDAYDEIMAFAELQGFEDRPFRQLSSGMKSRLAFSVASMVKPDLLILDEVLSVGDGAFKKKSEAKMREIISSGATTILVSHSIEQVKELCNKVLWLHKGEQIAFGDTKILCVLYQKFLDKEITLEEARTMWQKMNNHYNYLIVGAGLFGATFAQRAKADGKSVLVIDKRNHIGGNVYTEKIEGINVHKYGAHIFHTNDDDIWTYVNQFAKFNDFENNVIANYNGELYNLPFNMNTFHQMWGVNTPEEAQAVIEKQRAEITNTPTNLEEQAISLVGRDIYEKLIKGYTEKQWGRPCNELPAFIIKRLPVRFEYNNNYFNAKYQGIPIGGYTGMVEKMLDGVDTMLGVDYLSHKEKFDALADKVIYTGPIDAYFDYCYGPLQYRSVRFENELLNVPSFQGNAAVNYTDAQTSWTRIIEHKWFEFGKDEFGNDLPQTVISREYSSEWKLGDEPYYPVNDEKNGELYCKYKALADTEEKVVFGGRLGEYKYYDMDQVIASALKCANKEL